MYGKQSVIIGEMKNKTIGVIDIGTLKVKMLIGSFTNSGEFITKYQSNELTCLGVKMSENNNRPLPKYLQQSIDELKRCKKVLEENEVTKIKVVSTHALREMGSVGIEIAKTIRKEVGLNVEIISQQEEANLFFKAVVKDFRTDDDFTIIDVGGGSVQVLIGNRNELKQIFLLKTGAQYLHDVYSPRHHGQDFPTKEEIAEMRKYVLEQMAILPEGLGTPVVYGSSCIIDVFKTLGLKLDDNNLSESHPIKTEVKEMEKFMDKIIPIPYDEREKMFNFYQKYYMWGIEKAFLNVISVCQRESAPFVIPSNANINQGLIQSFL